MDPMREIEQKMQENVLCMDEIMSHLIHDLGHSQKVIEEALYRASVSSGSAPLQIAILVHEVFACLQDIRLDEENTKALELSPLSPSPQPQEDRHPL